MSIPKLLIPALFSTVVVICPTSAYAQTPLRVMTWNIQSVGSPGTTQYNAAREVVVRLAADVIGINEISSSSDIGNLSALASDTGYPYLAISSSTPFSGPRNAVMSRYPILSSSVETSAMLSGDPGANDITRYIVVATIDVPGNALDTTVAVMHWKSGVANADEFRRALESFRVSQAINGFDLNSEAVLVLGDINEELDSVPRSPAVFTSLPTGLPFSFELGADLVTELNGPGINNNPFAYLTSGANLVPLDARQLDGSDATRPASGRRLDYFFASGPLRTTTPATEVYDANDEGLPGGLLKFGAPLSGNTTTDASDHFPVIVDLLVPASGTPPPPPPGPTSVWINELHYDNTGADSGEGVEIAGTAGTDLTGWQVVLYNGNGGGTYRIEALGGAIPDLSNGFGSVDVPIASVQNGGPDGVALIDHNGNVVEFLSYEGIMTATDGPAVGQTSVDIGVAETSATPTGQSLQRIGHGSVATDFTWTAPTSWTFGAINTGQSFDCVQCAPNVWVNELHYDNAGADTGEGIEIAGTAGTDLTGFTIVLYNGNNQSVYQTVALSQAIPNQSSGLGTVFVAIVGVQNGAPDGVALVDNTGAVIEFLSYEGTMTAVDGPAVGQSSTDIGVEESGSTPVGWSLQRSGSGNTAADFGWVAADVDTPGDLNNGQSFTP